MNMRYLRQVVTLELDETACRGCGMCLQVCPHGVFALENGRAVLRDRDACMECGACQRNCPFAAVRVQSGVGCANALIRSAVKGGEPQCGCDSSSPSSCCG